MIRRRLAGFVAVSLFAWCALGQEVRAEVDSPHSFIQTLGGEAIEMLSDSVLTEEDRVEEFRRILIKAFDLRTIGRFVLGRYWRRTTPDERREFEVLFEDYIVATYSTRLGQYQGEALTVSATRSEGNGDILVTTQIVPRDGPTVRVEWRVRGKPGSYKIIDVVVEGISMVITQRSEFASVIQRSGGQVSGLLDELRKKIRRK